MARLGQVSLRLYCLVLTQENETGDGRWIAAQAAEDQSGEEESSPSNCIQ
jgi:hypothetical protein